jgi:pilus assembly protein CpaB
MAMRPAPLPPAGLLDEQSPLAVRVRAVTALGARHRRLLAALCAGAAVLVAVSALTPAPPPATPATSAAASGPGSLPAAALPAAAGALAPGDADRVAVAVRLADPAGLLLLRVGAHVEVLAGPPPDSLPSTGSDAASDAAEEVLAPDAVVLAVPMRPGVSGADDAGSVGDGASGLLAGVGGRGQGGQAAGATSGLDGVVLLAVPPSDARRLAAAASTRPLSVAVGLPATPTRAP